MQRDGPGKPTVHRGPGEVGSSDIRGVCACKLRPVVEAGILFKISSHTNCDRCVTWRVVGEVVQIFQTLRCDGGGAGGIHKGSSSEWNLFLVVDIVALRAELGKASGRLNQVNVVSNGVRHRVVKSTNLLDVWAVSVLVRLESGVQQLFSSGHGSDEVDPLPVVEDISSRNARVLEPGQDGGGRLLLRFDELFQLVTLQMLSIAGVTGGGDVHQGLVEQGMIRLREISQK